MAHILGVGRRQATQKEATPGSMPAGAIDQQVVLDVAVGCKNWWSCGLRVPNANRPTRQLVLNNLTQTLRLGSRQATQK